MVSRRNAHEQKPGKGLWLWGVYRNCPGLSPGSCPGEEEVGLDQTPSVKLRRERQSQVNEGLG